MNKMKEQSTPAGQSGNPHKNKTADPPWVSNQTTGSDFAFLAFGCIWGLFSSFGVGTLVKVDFREAKKETDAHFGGSISCKNMCWRGGGGTLSRWSVCWFAFLSSPKTHPFGDNTCTSAALGVPKYITVRNKRCSSQKI